MVDWVKPEHQRGGKKEKPKKELGKVYDIAQVVLPIVASVVATPLAGAAVAALMQGAETKLEGGSWRDAAISGALSGGIGAATGGIASGIGGGAGSAVTEGAKKIGEGVITEAGKAALTEGGKQAGAFGLDIALDQAGNIVKETAIQKTLATVGDEVAKKSMQSIASGMGSPGGESIGKMFSSISDKKAQFINDVGDLAEGGLGVYSELSQEAEGKKRMSEALNDQLMRKVQGAMSGEYVPTEASFYKKKKGYSPYGGYNG